MSLDVYLICMQPVDVFDANITHNLVGMAKEAGIYEFVWRPEESGIAKAGDLIPHLKKGIADMESRPDHFRSFDSPNGWGKYDDFMPWLKNYLDACETFPHAEVRASR